MSKTKEPRPYQIELLQKALKQNSIVYLSTGAGKTFIATMMIKEKMAEVLHSNKKTVFLVHRVPLAVQQAKFIKDNTPLSVRSFCGGDNVDFWNLDQWNQEIERHQVLVMIHDVFKLCLSHGGFCMDRVNLLIIDECHHSSGNSSFNQIFTQFYHPLKEERPDDVPHVLALSASIVVSKTKTLAQFMQEKEKLEKTLDSNVITTFDMVNLLKFATQPEEITVEYRPSPINKKLSEIIVNGLSNLESLQLNEMRNVEHQVEWIGVPGKLRIDEIKSTTKKFRRILNQTEMVLVQLGLYHGENFLQLSQEWIEEELLVKSESPFKLNLSKSVKKTIESLNIFLDNEIRRMIVPNDIMKYSKLTTDKVKKLVEILEQNHHEMTAIIFVQERHLAVALASFLIELSELKKETLGHLRVGFAVGGNSSGKFREPLSKSLQEKADLDLLKLQQAIEAFKTRKINCLVSTSVLEEGIDIIQCNLVIRFDKIQEFRSYVQSKGRARAKPSKFIVMVESGTSNWDIELLTYKKIENMQIENTHEIENDEDSDDKEEMEETFYADPSDKIKSPQITGLTSISTLTGFVQNLPHDRFTKLVPYFDYEEKMVQDPREKLFSGLGIGKFGTVRSILHMPHGTGYREPLIGPLRKNKKQAKRAVSLEMCKKLYEDDFLDWRLLPRKRVLDTFAEEMDEKDTKRPKIGTKRSKSYYPNEIPSPLLIQKNEFHLYRINLKLIEESEHARNVKKYSIYRPENFPTKLGIVIGSKLPRPLTKNFELFTVSGTVNFQLEYMEKMAQIENLSLIKNFYVKSLQDVTGFNSKIVQKGLENEPFFVPLNKDGQIDHPFLQNWLRNLQENLAVKNFKFDGKNFQDAVVIPQHREMGNFIVEKIVSEKNPESLMPKSGQSFRTHYENQYKAKISDLNQPLLRISNADKKYFMFAPIGQDGGNSAPKSETFLDSKTLLVPELVKIHPIPASLWREIQMFPFVWERLTSMFNLYDFLQKMPSKAFYNLQSTQLTKKIDFPNLLVYENGLGKIGSCDILEAVTLKGCGETFDMEKLETLGDSFLKYSMTLSLFCNQTIKKRDEGYLTQYRSLLVGNKRLFTLAVKNGIDQLVSARKFEPHLNWKPPGFTSKRIEDEIVALDEEFRNGEVTNLNLFQVMTESDWITFDQSRSQEFLKVMKKRCQEGITNENKIQSRHYKMINDKSLADVIEALIGCHLFKAGQAGASQFLAFIGLAFEPQHEISKVINYEVQNLDPDWMSNVFLNMPTTSVWHPDFASDLGFFMRKINVDQIQSRLGYEFKDKSFLLQALTHASYTINMITDSYERLEFLGDAVLDFLVTCHLVWENPNLSPGQITDLRSALVNNNTLADLAINHNLQGHLLSQSPDLMKRIDAYVNLLREDFEQNHKLFNEEEMPVLEEIEVPKALGDLIESLIGAVYLDSNCDLAAVWKVVLKLYGYKMQKIIKKKPRNFITKLMELFPERVSFSKAKVLPDAKVSREVTVKRNDHDDPLTFRGIGPNKNLAKLAASKCALRNLKCLGIIEDF